MAFIWSGLWSVVYGFVSPLWLSWGQLFIWKISGGNQSNAQSKPKQLIKWVKWFRWWRWWASGVWTGARTWIIWKQCLCDCMICLLYQFTEQLTLKDFPDRLACRQSEAQLVLFIQQNNFQLPKSCFKLNPVCSKAPEDAFKSNTFSLRWSKPQRGK